MSIEVTGEPPSGSEPQPPEKPLGEIILQVVLPAYSAIRDAKKNGVGVTGNDSLIALGLDLMVNAGAVAFSVTPDGNAVYDPAAPVIKVAGSLVSREAIRRRLEGRPLESRRSHRPVKHKGGW